MEGKLRANRAGASDQSARPGACRGTRGGLSRALLRAAFCGKPALPALLGRGTNLAGPSGYWVGHSSGSFAVGLLSVREPSLRARFPRISCGPERRKRRSTRVQRPLPLIGLRFPRRAGRRRGSLHPGSIFPCSTLGFDDRDNPFHPRCPPRAASNHQTVELCLIDRQIQTILIFGSVRSSTLSHKLVSMIPSPSVEMLVPKN